MQDEILIDVDTADNSTTNAISTAYLNKELRLEINWERHDNFTSYSWGNNINSTTNSGCVPNSLSNEGSAGRFNLLTFYQP